MQALLPFGLIGRFIGLALAGDNHDDDEDCFCDRTFGTDKDNNEDCDCENDVYRPPTYTKPSYGPLIYSGGSINNPLKSYEAPTSFPYSNNPSRPLSDSYGAPNPGSFDPLTSYVSPLSSSYSAPSFLLYKPISDSYNPPHRQPLPTYTPPSTLQYSPSSAGSGHPSSSYGPPSSISPWIPFHASHETPITQPPNQTHEPDTHEHIGNYSPPKAKNGCVCREDNYKKKENGCECEPPVSYETGNRITNYQAPIFVQLVQDGDYNYSNYQNLQTDLNLERHTTSHPNSDESHLDNFREDDSYALNPDLPSNPSASDGYTYDQSSLSQSHGHSSETKFEFNFPLYYPQFDNQQTPSSGKKHPSNPTPVYFSTSTYTSGSNTFKKINFQKRIELQLSLTKPYFYK
ncbi:DNA-directed RNA polymerase II subunit RPB1-like [Eurytemora carolleeae]|uniref:DNA-directed RNA polymerase II subunit RPB1-like n=1 Tax=Eurytemora carolleeae TaxID=1294199 RepID=UPI000C788D4F|nr:DNA-directed RNA polymerase II subunit RPB1-like [Eurytemora carolleeae]|eukprot:XP_023349003.1 DNA-directed RNA polymerase II subunit RPB1-like [Eurytemora affinis]